MSEFKHHLEKKAAKGTCPHCNQKGKWRFFEGFHGNTQFGKCERTNNCPSEGKTFFPDSTSIYVPSPKQAIERTRVLIEPTEANYFIGDQSSNLHKFLIEKGISNEHLTKWNVGTDTTGNTTLFFCDREGKFVNRKTIQYDAGGHREKTTGAWSLVRYQCKSCKHEDSIKHKKCPNCKAVQTYEVHPTHYYALCLFGEHLLDPDRKKIVCIVESEKTAIVASFFYPEHDWVSCAAANGLSDGSNDTNDKITPLFNRHLWWICDADKAGRKNSSINNLVRWSLKHDVIDLFKDRTDGWDLADEILTTGQKPNIEPAITTPTAELFIPKEAKAEEGNDPIRDYKEYGFFRMKNQYWKMQSVGDGHWSYKAFTNFAMKVLFHMDNGKVPRRVIEMVNIHGRKKVVDTPTNNLGSRGKFIDFIEGNGNFQFFGTDGDLGKLKSKLFDEEVNCREIVTLGWHDEKFFAWSNGIYNGQFSPVSENGFVQFGADYLYIRAGNKNVPNRKTEHANELKFRHIASTAIEKPFFEQWAAKYYEVFGFNGMIVQLFTLSCLFSDHIFDRKGFFPILFFYGEGGSGKGSAIKFAQYLFGSPQDPLTLSGKANTDKSKIATFAQLVNTMLLLEEYVPNHDTDQLLKNLFDRYGYKRRTLDSTYRTESVPINSGVACTGNYAPSDDPLLQRLIFLNHNKNEFTQTEKDNFNALKNYSLHGITDITHQVLNHRAVVEEKFDDDSKHYYKEMSALLKGTQCTDRMVENVTVLYTIFRILKDAGLKFPFTDEVLKEHLVFTTRELNNKRESGGEVQKFWELFIYNINEEKIFHDRDFLIDGDRLSIRYTQVHQAYLQSHGLLHRANGLSSATMLDKLKHHASYIDSVRSKRFGNAVTSAVEFTISKTGIDISIDVVNVAAEYGRRKRGQITQQADATPMPDGTVQGSLKDEFYRRERITPVKEEPVPEEPMPW